MKKVIALALALVLALSLGVSAFALEPIALKKASADYASVKDIIDSPDGEDGLYMAYPEGGTYYFTLGGLKTGTDFEEEFDEDSFEVETTGGLEAEVVEYDPETMYADEVTYAIKTEKKTSGKWAVAEDSEIREAVKTILEDLDSLDVSDYIVEYNNHNHNDDYAQFDNKNYDFMAAVADILNDDYSYSNTFRYSVETVYGENNAEYLLKVTVPANYGVAYTEGDFTVKAIIEKTTTNNKGTKKVTTKEVEYEGTIYTDVVIFTYDDVNDAHKKQVELSVGMEGYSDYYTQGKYGKNYFGTVEGNATVVCTTAFRALRENGYSLVVTLGEKQFGEKIGHIDVSIEKIAAAQKGVNFAGYELGAFNKDGRELTKWFGGNYYDLDRKDLNNKDTDVAYLGFGFYGNQVIASDFTLTYDLEINAYELREIFGKALEEEDIITYYIVKDGKTAGTFTIDYLDDEQAFKDVKLEIAGKAGDTLGEYRLQLTAPAGAEGEENPNTGAESVVGVVAALAVVSLASAAAISLKK